MIIPGDRRAGSRGISIRLEREARQDVRGIDEKIIPMINIIFLLLMFFLIVGNISELVREDVVPPRSSSAGVAVNTQGQWVLTEDGSLLVEGRQMELEQLGDWFAEAGNRTTGRVVLRADGGMSSGLLLPLLDVLREQGVENVALVTINEDGPR